MSAKAQKAEPVQATEPEENKVLKVVKSPEMVNPFENRFNSLNKGYNLCEKYHSLKERRDALEAMSLSDEGQSSNFSISDSSGRSWKTTNTSFIELTRVELIKAMDVRLSQYQGEILSITL